MRFLEDCSRALGRIGRAAEPYAGPCLSVLLVATAIAALTLVAFILFVVIPEVY